MVELLVKGMILGQFGTTYFMPSDYSNWVQLLWAQARAHRSQSKDSKTNSMKYYKPFMHYKNVYEKVGIKDCLE